jgi:hypothetical protein
MTIIFRRDGKMLRKILTIVVQALLCFSLLSGCKGSSSESPAEQEAVKTEAEYKAEADKEINKDNMAEELDKIEKTMAQEATQEQ